MQFIQRSFHEAANYSCIEIQVSYDQFTRRPFSPPIPTDVLVVLLLGES